VMEFIVTGASAVQVGTANFAEPVVSTRLLDELPAALADLGAARVADVVGTLALPAAAASCPPSAGSHADGR
jgi:dihydroorotate dehydrogenase (NAD+) catalytic subunit